MHSPAAFDPETGLPTGPPSRRLDQRVRRGDGRDRGRRDGRRRDHRGDARPTGLAPFAEAYPERCIDVGIAEQHALTSAAGLACGGPAPRGRGVLDVPQPGLRPAADGRGAAPAGRHARAGPGRRHRQRRAVAQRHVGPVAPRASCPACGWPRPRDAATLREELAEAVAVDDGPTAIRFPKGAVIESVPAVRRVDGRRRAARGRSADRRGRCWCARARSGSWAWPRRQRLARQGVSVTVVDPRWVLPVPDGRSSRWRASTGLVVTRRRRRPARRLRLRAGRRAARGRVRRAGARSGDPAGVPRPRQPGRRAGRGRADRAGRRPADHRVGGGAACPERTPSTTLSEEPR